MKKPESRTVFAGVDGHAETQLPTWYAQRHRDIEPVSFAEAIRELPRASEATVAYRNPLNNRWIETDRFNAIVEPSRLRDQARGDDTIEPLFHIPSDSYTILNPVDVYGPLEDVLREETIDEVALGDIVFGEIRQYRAGGEIHMDVLFDGLEVELPDRSDPITMGLRSGYDFFGGRAVYVEGFAQDGLCTNTLRQLTDKEVIKHIGDVKDFRTWWERILSQINLVANDLAVFISEAQDIELDFVELPFSVSEFYELLGFPEYLAERAAADAEANAPHPFDSPFTIDMWTLHSGGTYALTHFFQGKEGAALDRHVRVANDILINPDGTVDRVVQAFKDRLASGEGSQSTIEGKQGLATIERVGDDIRTKAEQFENREEALRARFQEVMD